MLKEDLRLMGTAQAQIRLRMRSLIKAYAVRTDSLILRNLPTQSERFVAQAYLSFRCSYMRWGPICRDEGHITVYKAHDRHLCEICCLFGSNNETDIYLMLKAFSL